MCNNLSCPRTIRTGEGLFLRTPLPSSVGGAAPTAGLPPSLPLRPHSTWLGVCGRQQQLTEVRVLDILDPTQIQEAQGREVGGAERRHRAPRAACQNELLEACTGETSIRGRGREKDTTCPPPSQRCTPSPQPPENPFSPGTSRHAAQASPTFHRRPPRSLLLLKVPLPDL